MRIVLTYTLACLVLVATGTPAYAYLDPGTGSIFLQVILGIAAGVLVAGKIYWAKIKDLFSRKPPEPPVSGNHASED